MKKIESISVRKITELDYRFLYELLTERSTNENISHKSIPNFKQHVKFVESKPYTNWYVIYQNGQKCGSIYLSRQNEIGIWLKKEFDSRQAKKDAIKLIINKNPRSRYLININPKNTKMKNFLQKNKFKLIQHTYELNSTKK